MNDKFDLHDYFRSRCELISKQIDVQPDLIRNLTEGVEGKTGYMKSPSIEITYNIDKIEEQYENALYAMTLCVYAIKSMGFDIKIEKLYWHTIKDSDYNLWGNKGFYVMEYSFEKSTK